MLATIGHEGLVIVVGAFRDSQTGGLTAERMRYCCHCRFRSNCSARMVAQAASMLHTQGASLGASWRVEGLLERGKASELREQVRAGHDSRTGCDAGRLLSAVKPSRNVPGQNRPPGATPDAGRVLSPKGAP